MQSVNLAVAGEMVDEIYFPLNINILTKKYNVFERTLA